MVWSRFFKDFGKRLLWLASICLGLVVAFHVWNFVSLLVWRWLVGMDGCDGSWGLRCYSDREFLDFAVWTNQAFWARLFSVIILVIVTNVLWYLIISPLIREYWRTHDTCHNKACTCVLHPKPYEADSWDEEKGYWVENMAKCPNPDCKCVWNHSGQKFSKKKGYWVDKI